MPIELHLSNQLDALAEKLSDAVAAEVRAKDNILDPPRIIVPNANLARWLQLSLAEKNSVFMNIEFQYLEEGLWNLLAALDTGEIVPEMIDQDQLTILLLHTLQNLDPTDPDLQPIRRYLYGDSASRGRIDAARLWQLSAKFAHLFKEYEYHRTDMIRQWLNPNQTPAGMVRCQQRLYAAIQQTKGNLSQQRDKPLLSMVEYADRLLAGSRKRPELAPDLKLIHLFGLSQISGFHLSLVDALQTYYRIHIYTMNPCQEFWEDIQTPGEKRWVEKRNVLSLAIEATEQDQADLLGEPDHELLAVWGRPGRENIRLLCGLADYDFNACYAPFGRPAGVLQHLQNSFLTRSAVLPVSHRPGQDTSLQMAACPSIYREVETVHSSILYNLSLNDDLQLTDIAILVPDMSTYRPAIDSVFNRRPQQLVYNLVDSHADIESIYGKAVLAVLQLATGKFSRSDVFNLISNPCFMYRWGIEPDDVQAWVGWASDLNIFHSFDRKAKAPRGYPESDSYTWQLGLERLRLSRIMASPTTTDPAGFDHYRGRIPFADIKADDPDLLEKFCTVIETLRHGAEGLNARRLDGKAWKVRFLQTCDRLLDIPPDLRGESAVRQALVEAFDRLELHDRCRGDASEPFLDIDLVRQFVASSLRAVPGGQGSYLTGGVTISALQPMRPIPFHIVYVLGMEEGNFPGRADQSILDLRLLKRRIGDVSLPERNRYLFLEMLLSVRSKLYISYVSRDLQKDRIQQPCSVVSQLKRFVETEVLPEGESFKTADIPLAGSSPRYLEPGSISNWSDLLVNESIADRVACYRSSGLWDRFARNASAADLERLGRFNPDLSMGRSVSQPDEQPVEQMTLQQLRHYLLHPVHQKLRRHLGLYDEEESVEEVVLREDEPFFSEFPLDYRLTLDPINLWLDRRFEDTDASGNPDPEALYRMVYDTCRRKSLTPEGAYSDIDRDGFLHHVLEMTEAIKPFIDSMSTSRELFRAVSIGNPGEPPVPLDSSLSSRRFDPLSLTVETLNHASGTVVRQVEAIGRLPWIWRQSDGSLHVLVVTGSRRTPKAPDRHVIGPVLFYLMCLASEDAAGWMSGSRMTVHTIYREGSTDWTYRFSPEFAGVYLSRLASSLLNQATTSWLPFGVVSDRSRTIRPYEMAEGEITDSIRVQYAAELLEALDGEDDRLIQLAGPVVPEDAFDRVRIRFAPFFSHLEDDSRQNDHPHSP